MDNVFVVLPQHRAETNFRKERIHRPEQMRPWVATSAHVLASAGSAAVAAAVAPNRDLMKWRQNESPAGTVALGVSDSE